MVEVPFQIENNFIIVKLTINNRLPLNFIFDTGAEHTILTKSLLTSVLNLKLEREFRVLGADMSTYLSASLARNVSYSMGELSLTNKDILVLKEDYFNFENYTGTLIHGILGANIFKHFIVKIDYNKRIITFHRYDHFRSGGYKEIPVVFSRNKPYIIAQVKPTKDTTLSKRLLIDTGASLSMLLHIKDSSEVIPPNTIIGNVGKGIGGNLEGIIGKVDELQIGEYYFDYLITNFQHTTRQTDTTLLDNRDGIIGNKILQRFTIVIDYPHDKLYLDARKRYNRKFKSDRSGISMVAGGKYLNQYTVQYIVEASPAYEAGIRRGDRILSINGISTKLRSLAGMTKLFQSSKNKRIRLKIRRDEKKQKVCFRLRDLL